LHLW
jgi:hypothetical protein